MKRIFYTLLLIFPVVHFCAAQTDSAGNKKIYTAPWFVEKFRLSAGAFIPVNNTNVKVSGTDGNIGSNINFENDLGFNKTTGTFFADFQYRLTRRSRFDLGYYGISRSSTYTLKKDIIFGDNTYPVNASVGAFFNTDIYRFSYGYSVIEKPKYEAGFLIGAHIIHSNVGLQLNGTTIAKQDNFGFTAPLPDLGIWGGYSFSNRFAVNGEIDYLAIKVGDIKGRLLGGSVSFLYHVMKQFDLSIGYTGLNFRVDANKPKLTGNFKWGYNGPALTATFSFGKKYWVQKN